MSKAFILPERKRHYEVADWQLEDLAYMTERMQRTHNSANWSEMGCYKTTSLEWLLQGVLRNSDKPPLVLIVTTKSGKGTYFQTLPDVLPDWTVYDVTTQKVRLLLGHDTFIRCDFNDLPYEPKTPTIVVTSYSVFSKRKPSKKEKERIENGGFPKVTMRDDLQFRDWDLVALDESHRIKNMETSWTIELKKMNRKYSHVMTGTGFINNPAEIFSQLQFLEPQVYTSYWHFRDLWCAEYYDLGSGFRVMQGIKKEKEEDFRALVRSFGPRRFRKEVFPDLETPIFDRIDVELSPIQRRMYDDIKHTLYTLDQQGEPIHSPNVLSMLSRLRQVCVATPQVINDYFDPVAEKRILEIQLTEPSSKLDALMEVLEGMEDHEKIVVFSCFKGPLELLKKRLDVANISYLHMDVRDSEETRYQKWAVEFPKPQYRVFLSTLQLGSESINLTPAATCIFLDRSWSPKDNHQGYARIARPGQVNKPLIIHLEAENTTDQRIEKVNERKMGWFEAIFGEEKVEEFEDLDAERFINFDEIPLLEAS